MVLGFGQTKSTASRSFVTNHTVQLTELSPGTDYHFRIVAEDEDANITRSSDLIFTTIASPSFESISATVNSANEATITWRTNVFASGIINYKSDTDPETQTAGDASSTREHSIRLQNLFGLTEYTYTITATDGLGTQVSSTPRTFTTSADAEPPKITNLKVNVTRSGEELVMTVTWKTNEPAKSQVFYNPKNNVENLSSLPESTSFITDHVVVAIGIEPSTPYALRVIVKDPFNNESEETISFVSPGLRRSIFQLIIDSILKPFGWLARLFEG